ncbi:MAG: L,D-transpeptidase [Chloroflexi bacterium]|nr:L,D-transpeptidase [Chloroflexota bacterium]
MIKRNEWFLVSILAVLTVFSLSFAPRPSPSNQELVDVLSTATATRQITATLSATASRTPTATPSATPSTTPTFTRTYTPSVTPTITATATPSATPFPFDTRGDLPRYIYIDQAVQHMYVFEWGKLVRDIPCSTGLPEPDKYTDAWSGRVGPYWGTFFAFDVYADDAWYLFKSLGSILIHSLPYTLENGRKVYQDRDALGVRPSSHGCIRIAPEDAAWFTAWNPEGVEITITDPYLDKWR